MTDTQKPDPVRLANELSRMDMFTKYQSGEILKAAAELRRLHGEVEALQARLAAWEAGTASACARGAIVTATDLLAENEALRADAADFQMKYRVKCDEQTKALHIEVEALRTVLKEVSLFLHHCWCDVQMNEYSFDKLNKMMEQVDAAMKGQP